MDQMQPCAPCPEPHFYGGQAVIEGVMMRGTDRYAVAVRRADGEIVVGEQPIGSFAQSHRWAKWPLVRGSVALVESLVLGYRALQFSAEVAIEEEKEKQHTSEGAQRAGDGSEAPQASSGSAGPPSPFWMALTTLLASALAIGLFIVLPTWAVDWLLGKTHLGASYANSVFRNLAEGVLRLAIVILYLLAISLLHYVRRVFQYHGAEHATINCFEAGEPVTTERCLRYGPLHPRCGTAFLLVVIVVKVLIGCFFGWPAPWLRSLIRVLLLPLVAGIAYEIIRWAGRHRQSLLSRVLAAPGMLMQIITTRRPDPSQIEVAIYALDAVADEVNLPAGWPPARRVPLQLRAGAVTEKQAAAE